MSIHTIFGRLMRSLDYAYDVMHPLTNKNEVLYQHYEPQMQVSWTVEHTQLPGVQHFTLLLESMSLGIS